MSPGRLFQYFEQISEAPEAVPHLRRFILDLAVRGKLVEQDPADEPATELVKRIETEKAQHAKEGKPPRPSPIPILNAEDLPCGIPANWRWCRLAELCLRIHYGYTASANPGLQEVRLLRITDIQEDRVLWDSVPGCEIASEQVDQYLRDDGDILIARTGGTIGKSFLVEAIPLRAVFASYLIRIQGSRQIFDRYLKLFFESPVYWEQLAAGARGTGQPNVNGQILGNMAVPLPPPAEQQRIVAKVDELMTLCDELEAARAKRERRRDRLVAATLHGLNNGDPPSDSGIGPTFEDSARFYFNHLPCLTTRPEHIHQFRQTILNLAIRGKLVAQNPNEGSGLDLLENMRKVKEQLMRERGVRSEKDVEYSMPADMRDFPSRWAWAHVDDVAIVQGGKRLPKGVSFAKVSTSHIYIRVTDMKNGTIMTNDLQYITPEVQRAIARYTINKEDLYITIAGTIGQVGRVPAFFDGHNLTENAAKLVFRSLSADFLRMALSSDFVQQQFRDKTKQMAQPKLALKRIAGARFPLPPLAEQHRIVAKADELMALCDELDARLTTTATTRRQLLEATLAEAIASS